MKWPIRLPALTYDVRRRRSRCHSNYIRVFNRKEANLSVSIQYAMKEKYILTGMLGYSVLPGSFCGFDIWTWCFCAIDASQKSHLEETSFYVYRHVHILYNPQIIPSMWYVFNFTYIFSFQYAHTNSFCIHSSLKHDRLYNSLCISF